MQELSTDSSAPKPRYDVYFSYSEAEWPRVAEISERLKVLGPDFRWFDELELTPGHSGVADREAALATSGSVAVLFGPGDLGKMVVEEQSQAIQRSIDQETRVFAVYLPGWDGVAASWLRGRSAVDLRGQFDDEGHLSPKGLIDLIAAVRGMTKREAGKWLAQQHSPPPGPPTRASQLRALVVGIQHYHRYPELPSAASDVQSVERLLRSTSAADGGRWEIGQSEQPGKDQLAGSARTFFDADVGPDDTLLFYFSGHGWVDGNHDLYLVASGTDPDDIVMTAFPIKALAGYVKNSKSRRKLVLLDCCFSGEASDHADWGPGTAVFMTSRQAVSASAGPSEFTELITAAWESGAQTTGDLRDRLTGIAVHVNQEFDGSIPLPQTEGVGQWPAADSLPSVRLSFNEAGELYVSLSASETAEPVRCVEVGDWLRSRRHLITSLIEMIDAVVSLVPPDKLPMESVKKALSSFGADLLSSILTAAVRDRLGEDLDAWPELRLQLTFDDRWNDRGSMEQLPWESMVLCRDHDRAVWLERIVPAKATKNGARRRPSRVIAWNAFTEAYPRYDTGAKHLLTHLLRAELTRQPRAPKLVVKEPASWGDLFEASRSRSVEVPDPQQGGETKKFPISDFDTFLLFAPVSIVDGEPGVSFSKQGMAPVRASNLLQGLRQWAFSYLVIETIAGQATLPLPPGPESAGSRAHSLQATTQLATELASQLGVTVVAVCHLPSFLNLARPDDDEETTFMPSFSGQFLRQLADPSLTVHAAAQEARRLIVSGLNREEFLDVGLPVVCRPEPKPLASRRTLHTGRVSR